jgi:hypothetical protein
MNVMNLYSEYNSHKLQPFHQTMHLIYDDLLNLSCDICKSEIAFLIIWEENFHISYNKQEGIKSFCSTDFEGIKKRFQTLNAELFYAQNVKHHTLFQDLYFFEFYSQSPQLLAYPILDNNGKAIGILGQLYKEEPISAEQHKTSLKHLQEHVQKLHNNNLLGNNKSKVSKPLYVQSLDQLPGAHFEYTIDPQGRLGEIFISDEASKITPLFTALKNSLPDEELFQLLHQKSFESFKLELNNKKKRNSIEYAYQLKNEQDKASYYMLKVNTFRNDMGEILCLGAIKDISFNKTYEAILEQIIFDITHIMRRPVATMLGLTNLIELDRVDENSIKDVAQKLRTVSTEMDEYIRNLYNNYQQRWEDYENIQEEEE